MGVKFQSRIVEKTSTEIATTIVWIGTREEMLQLQRDTPINGLTDDGMVKSVRVNQVSPLIWQCEQRFTLAADGELTEKPDNSYGKKSAQLHGSMLSMGSISTRPCFWVSFLDTLVSLLRISLQKNAMLCKKHSTAGRKPEQKSFAPKGGVSRVYSGFFAIFPPLRG